MNIIIRESINKTTLELIEGIITEVDKKKSSPDRESYHLEAIFSYASLTSSTELYIFTPKTKKSKGKTEKRSKSNDKSRSQSQYSTYSREKVRRQMFKNEGERGYRRSEKEERSEEEGKAGRT